MNPHIERQIIIRKEKWLHGEIELVINTKKGDLPRRNKMLSISYVMNDGTLTRLFKKSDQTDIQSRRKEFKR